MSDEFEDYGETQAEFMARRAYLRLMDSQAFQDWILVGQMLLLIIDKVAAAHGVTRDKLLKTPSYTREAYEKFAEWERPMIEGTNHTPLTKQERWALRELMTKREIVEWYTTHLSEATRRRVVHPHSIINRFNAWKRGARHTISPKTAVRGMVDILLSVDRSELREEDKKALRELFEKYAEDFKIIDAEPAEIAGLIEDMTDEQERSGWVSLFQELARIAEDDDARFLAALEMVLRILTTMTPMQRRVAHEDIADHFDLEEA